MKLPHQAMAKPVLIKDGTSYSLTRLALGSGTFSEKWLQAFIFDKPEVLPVTAIEPAFYDPLPVACEVPCEVGFIDNIYVTPRGDIVLVETKLWQNPEARRELVAQVLDYVAALMAMSYAQFEAALCRGQPSRISGTLYQLVSAHPDALSEADFIDAVATNLARGRILALAVGDGIRSEAKALASLLQSHAGAHFTFALVEIGVWHNPFNGELVCMPSTLAQTVMIERGIVVIDQGRAKVMQVPSTAASAKPHTITEAMFAEQLAAIDPALPEHVRQFLELVAPYGVYPDQRATLTLRADIGSKPVNLGAIDKAGKLWTDYVVNSLPADVAQRYLACLADMIGGTLPESGPPKVTTNGKTAPLVSAFLPQHAEAWAASVATLIRDAHDQAERENA